MAAASISPMQLVIINEDEYPIYVWKDHTHHVLYTGARVTFTSPKDVCIDPDDDPEFVRWPIRVYQDACIQMVYVIGFSGG